MAFFARRRLINSAATLTALAAAWRWSDRLENRLHSASFVTGWLLLVAIGFLAAFQLRKKLPAPALGSASIWMQLHIYVGLATAGLFAIHAGAHWPTGVLETALAVLYAVTFVSGLVGLYWTRTLPRRLSRVGEEVIYERIESQRGLLRDRAQAAILLTVRTAGATTLGEFYRDRLHDYFTVRRGWGYRLWPTSRLRKQLLGELTESARYLSDAERKTAEDLFALVRRRDDLDYHEALQWRLRAWLLGHIALTYPLIALAVVHARAAHLYYGGAP